MQISKLATLGLSATLLCACGGVEDELYDDVEPTSEELWANAAPMLTPRYQHGAARAKNGKLYVIGGKTATHLTTPLSSVEEYDYATNTWRYVRSLPEPRLGIGVVAAYNDFHEVYAISGSSCTTSSYGSTKTWRFSPPTLSAAQCAPSDTSNACLGVWREVRPIPYARLEHGATSAWTWNAPIYVMGGVSLYGNSRQAYKFTLATKSIAECNALNDTTSDACMGRWTTLASLQYGRVRLAAAASGNYVYAIGGSGSTAGYITNTVERLDITSDTNTWQYVGALGLKRNKLAAITGISTGRIYAIGGTIENSSCIANNTCGTAGTPTTRVEMFDPATGVWTISGVPQLGTARSYPAAVMMYNDGGGNPALIALGGHDTANAVLTTQQQLAGN